MFALEEVCETSGDQGFRETARVAPRAVATGAVLARDTVVDDADQGPGDETMKGPRLLLILLCLAVLARSGLTADDRSRGAAAPIDHIVVLFLEPLTARDRMTAPFLEAFDFGQPPRPLVPLP